MEKVCIVLSTFNGEKYLKEQIDSLLIQTGVDVTILVRDDGSKDNTVLILKEYAEKNGNISLLEKDFGVNFGVAKSFIFLLTTAAQMFPKTSYFFFADQDDVWLPDKCSRAVTHLPNYQNKAALYFSRKKLVDATLKPLGRKDYIRLTHTFWDYFDRSNAFGCTMCVTRPLVDALQDDRFYELQFLHDNYIYRLCLSANIPIFYDDAETILYRQHGDNVEGAVKKPNVFRGVKRLFSLRKKPHIIRLTSSYLLKNRSVILDKDNRMILELVMASYKSFKSKFKLILLYNKQQNRTLKEKLLRSLTFLINYN